mmetsp:Transcript_10136/g.29098  ORF Transcript_10136/g.29098 Transcript_10136/m.29098 type:complete len:212 (-) Transcript_10136:1808-2443(-)
MSQRSVYRQGDCTKEPAMRNLLQLKINAQQHSHPQFFTKYGISSWGAQTSTSSGHGMSETLRRVGFLEHIGNPLLDPPNACKWSSASSISTSKQRRKIHRVKVPALEHYYGTSRDHCAKDKSPRHIVTNLTSDSAPQSVKDLRPKPPMSNSCVGTGPLPSPQERRQEQQAVSEDTEQILMREILLQSYDRRLPTFLGSFLLNSDKAQAAAA